MIGWHHSHNGFGSTAHPGIFLKTVRGPGASGHLPIPGGGGGPGTHFWESILGQKISGALHWGKKEKKKSQPPSPSGGLGERGSNRPLTPGNQTSTFSGGIPGGREKETLISKRLFICCDCHLFLKIFSSDHKKAPMKHR